MSITVSYRKLPLNDLNLKLTKINDQALYRKQGEMASQDILILAERARLLPVLKRFPEERPTLQRLFRENSSFQSLCDDYRDCVAALQYWEQSASGEAPALARTYSELLGELEQEVRQYLEHEQAPGSKP